MPLCFLPLFLVANAIWYLVADPLSSNLMRNRLYNHSHVKQEGLLNYHLYDAYHWAFPRIMTPEPAPDQTIRARLALSAESTGRHVSHFGVAAGANVIVIQLESFQYFLIGYEVEGQEVTPFLNELRRESLYADALDQTGAGSTSDAMYVMLNSLHPPRGGPFCFLFPSVSSHALPRILKERGWRTIHLMSYDGAFWNTRIMEENFGFQQQYFGSN